MALYLHTLFLPIGDLWMWWQVYLPWAYNLHMIEREPWNIQCQFTHKNFFICLVNTCVVPIHRIWQPHISRGSFMGSVHFHDTQLWGSLLHAWLQHLKRSSSIWLGDTGKVASHQSHQIIVVVVVVVHLLYVTIGHSNLKHIYSPGSFNISNVMSISKISKMHNQTQKVNPSLKSL